MTDIYIRDIIDSELQKGFITFTIDKSYCNLEIGDQINVNHNNWANAYVITSISINQGNDMNVTARSVRSPYMYEYSDSNYMDELNKDLIKPGLVRQLKWNIGPFKPIHFLPHKTSEETVLVAFLWPFYKHYTWKVSITDLKGAFFQHQRGWIRDHLEIDIKIGRLIFHKRHQWVLNLRKKGNMHIIPLEYTKWGWFW